MATESSARPNPLVRALKFVWGLLDGVRRVVHLVLMLVVLALIIAALTPRPVEVPSGAALVLDPTGRLVEELSGDPLDRAIAQARGDVLSETRVRDLVDSLEAARDDDRIEVAVLRLDRLSGGGLSKLQQFARAIDAFRASGKRVIAYGEMLTQAQYYVAAHADEVYTHPFGGVYVEGLSYYPLYFGDALERLRVDVNVFGEGRYKTAFEPLYRSDMSPEDREMAEAFLGSLWGDWKEGAAAARGLEAEVFERHIDGLVGALGEAEGSFARLALERGFVDGTLHRDEFRDRMRELAPNDADPDKGFRGIGFRQYLAALGQKSARAPKPATDAGRVAVVVAAGEILPGQQPPGTVGADSTAALIRRATDDEGIRALVLRVDSPGGSAYASEIVRREVERFHDTGRPVIVSMGSVAASGGYWISMNADQIWASPTTITGSIGVLGIMPTVHRSLERIGIASDGLGTTWLAGAVRPDRELGDDARDLLRLSIAGIYSRFVEQVADSRGMSLEEADAAAQGRVYSGREARERGLVDELGDLEDAIAAAAGFAGIDDDALVVEYIERELTFMQRVALQFANASGPVATLAHRWLAGHRSERIEVLLERVNSGLKPFEAFGDPRGLVLHCFCEVE